MKKLLFVGIILLAILFRFYQLGVNPPSLTWDEAAWGYNAYSLGIDGKDEFGKFLPYAYFESFGDFKPPVYAYLTVIPVKIFGLNEFSTRFPSALFGVLTVILTYFLTQEIFFTSKQKDWYALAASFVLAISPWHVMLSRAAFEANVATFFIVCGVWLFLKAVHGKPWWLICSAISFVLSMYTFNSARVVSPLLVIFLAIAFWKSLFQYKKQTIIAAVVGILILAPIVKFLLSPQAGLRFQEVNIFSDSSVVTTSNQEVANDNNAFWSKIIHNRRWLYTESFLHHYFDNLTPSFLFIKGDGNPKFSTQDVGELYLWDLPFFIIGIFLLFRKKEGNWFVIPCWLLLAIIPAATARETPHALRTEAALPTFQILVAYGFVQAMMFVHSLKKNLLRKTIYVIVSVLLLMNVIYFVHGYLAHYAREYSSEWQYGYKQSIDYVQSVQDQYDQIQITDDLGRPYIYYLFYTKTDPKTYRNEAVIQRDAFGFVTVNQFGKYIFARNFKEVPGKKVLYIGRSSPAEATVKQTFYLENGQPILQAYTL